MIEELWKNVKKKKFSSIYLFYGAETFLVNETKQLLIQSAIDIDEEDFNLSSYDLEETPIEAILEDAETIPFFGERKVIVLHNPTFLTAEKTKSKVEHDIKKLEVYLQEPPPYTILVFIGSFEKLDERKKITKELKKKAEVLEAKKLTEAELKKWMRQRAAYNQVEMDEEALDTMLQLAGTNLFLLTSEVDKMALYVQDSHLITKEIVEELVAKSLEQNIFSLVDKVISRKIDEALRIYYDLIKQNEEPLKMLAIITNQFRLIYQVKGLSRTGYGQQQIASVLKVHPFRVKLAAGQAQKFSEQELLTCINLFAEADYGMKTGSMNKNMIIEMILFQIHDRFKQKSY
ncbi:DNA polymerase III subunit delta [Niallia nealsonii]|uniref:DNA polymerase III subunit delta n=1 Tax=Niallia nealsonii TaxID=115979 RepID=A0A2N0Z4P2_9BACI|nr:DNA polymerase III subunit delta [Niallia nealsonii]PKG24501.1 DNA polymerase III subunit delta [Niallia nealsonii]